MRYFLILLLCGLPEVAEFNRHVVDTCLAGGTLSFNNKDLVLLRNGQPETGTRWT